MTDAAERERGVEAEREPNFLLAPLERRFRLGYGLFGPTEIRAVLILLNTALAFDLGLDFHLVELDVTVLDVIGLGIVAVMLALLIVRVFGNLRELAREEPSAPRR